MPKHRMDCIDCHNRPTHIFTPPDRSVDDALVSHRLDPGMPFIKQQATGALTKTYQIGKEAADAIRQKLTDFYRTRCPSISSERIEQAVGETERIYNETIFPYMKVDWRTHPNNIGHLYFAGCFRCHDGQHLSSDGKVIPKQCDACHTLLSQTNTANPAPRVQDVFKHPIDIGDLAQVSCSDCHSGGSTP